MMACLPTHTKHRRALDLSGPACLITHNSAYRSGTPAAPATAASMPAFTDMIRRSG